MTKKHPGGWLYGVYHVQEPHRLRYAGITTVSIKSRSHGHWSNAKIDRPGKTHYGPIRSWLKKHLYNREDVVFRELAYFDTVDELKKAEITLIAESRKVGECDLNLTDGGEGGNGWRHTEESKRKLSEAFSGEKNPMYGRDRKELMAYALSFKGPVTEEMKENLSEKMTAWWDENPERRIEYSERVKRQWKDGKMPEMTRERAIQAVKSREKTLTNEQVRNVRVLRGEGETLKNIAEKAEISIAQVRSALGRKGAYGWVSGAEEVEDWNSVRLRRDGLTVDDIHVIRKLYDSGVANAEILEIHYPSLKRAKIQHITSRRGYKWIPEQGVVQ